MSMLILRHPFSNQELGTFFVEIEIGDPEGQRWVSVEALVDTGASTSSVPSSILSSLDVIASRQKRYRFAQGETRTMGVGQTFIRLIGEEFIRDFIFNEEGTIPLLGALALESAHLAVDSHGNRLIPEDGILL